MRSLYPVAKTPESQFEGPAKTMAAAVYAQIRRDIVLGRLEAGSKLRLEVLSKAYEIGMSPLREALARLTGDALVVTEGQRGYWVSPLSIEEFDDVTRVRTLIETEALHQSILQGDDVWERDVRQSFETLTEVEGRMEKGAEDLTEAFEHANSEFHKALISACGSPWLMRLADVLNRQSQRYRLVSLSNSRSRGRHVRDEHYGIMDAALARQALRACRLVERHFSNTQEIVREALQVHVAEFQIGP